MKQTIKKELNNLIPNSGIDDLNGNFGIRFELGGEENEDRIQRVNQATERGTEIFRQLIGIDELIIKIEEWENELYDPNNLNKKYLETILKDVELKRIKGPFKQTYYERDSKGNKIEKIFEEPYECDLLIGKTKISLDKVKQIIKGIASLEMGQEPCIPQDVTFFSISTRAGFRIYDDRGCDIWANSIETLKPIYDNLNSWILDYNRAEIDEMFETNK